MTQTDYTTTLLVDQTPDQAFAAINNVRGWWQGEFEGPTSQLGDEFTYRYKDFHWSRQKIVESVPGQRVAWQVLDGSLNFLADKTEWNGTQITFDIAPKGDQTQIVFTHKGLVPNKECYDVCADSWGAIIAGSLRSLIITGKAALDEIDNVDVQAAQ